MIKTYVIDTSVIIQSPDALTRFQDNVVVVPFVVLEKLGALSAVTSEQGINARKAIQMLEAFRLRGDLLQGVSLESGGILRVEKNYIDVALPKELPAESSDNRILKVCKGYQEVPDSQKPVILVTKSITLRLKAQMLGILAEDYTAEQVTDWASPYTGRMEVYVPEEQFKDFKKKGIPLKTVYTVDGNGIVQKPELFENQFVILRADQSAKKTLLGRVEKAKILPLKYKKIRPYGVNPQNVGQYFLQEALMQPASKAPLVIVKGMAGTAKTFYSLAVGLEKLINNPSGEYRKMIICRPNSQFDSDIGFLPGDEQDKIYPLMRPIVDNLEQLIDSNIEKRYENEQELNDKIEEIFDRGLIQTEALNFIRGRSIVKTYLIIDEAQNMTPNQMKGIITRAGEGTKIILLGDPAQIDRPLLDEKTNGLSYASQYMKGSPLCWQITLTAEECERSALAMDALKRL